MGIHWRCAKGCVFREDEKKDLAFLQPLLEAEKKLAAMSPETLSPHTIVLDVVQQRSSLHPAHYVVLQLLQRCLRQPNNALLVESDVDHIATALNQGLALASSSHPGPRSTAQDAVAEAYLRIGAVEKAKGYFLQSYRGWKTLGLESTQQCLRAQLRAIDPKIKMPNTL